MLLKEGSNRKVTYKMKKYIHYGSVAVVLAALLWSVDGLLRRNLYDLPPSVIVFWEHALGFALLLPLLLPSWRKFGALTRKQWAAMVLVALLSGALGTILYTAALGQVQYIPFSVVVLLQQLNPIFAIATSALLLKEGLSRRFVALTGIALVGAYFTTFPTLGVNFSTGKGTMTAALLAVGAAACWGIGTAFSKYALKGTSFPHVTAIRFGLTAVISLLIVGATHSVSAVIALTQTQFFYLVVITFSTGLLALLIYYYGLQRVPASRSATLELAWPLSSVIVGWLFLHQGLTLTQALGAIILTATTYLIVQDTRDSKPAESHQ